MTAVLLAVSLLLGVAGAPAAASDAIPWQDADGYIGEERTIEGRVIAARREGNVLRLTFDENPESFSVAIINSWLSPLPSNPRAIYEGRTIHATGRIRSFRSVSEMVIRDPSQIIIGAVEPEPSPTAPAGLEQRLQNLEDRVERLEQRLKK
jgi:DNA/RNA endonuclease YhcR with UshA esterase domain